ncbi:PAS fold protein [Roseivivax jejudonensis]|uniref:PAS fold protein n=1 Tax=Roseivivax jejudonensis TaxID=1529041 RepID=A0A1X6ZPU1_9RHOB|nr:transcriptional regulator PpsR [Roseivivax jejudonensis]SLN58111.1 PAS fold protein [Roseivivax jejudonensis]
MNKRDTSPMPIAATEPIEASVLYDLIAASSDVAIFVAPDGRVLSVLNGQDSARDPGVTAGRKLSESLTEESRPKLDSLLARVARGETPHRPTELNHRDDFGVEVPIAYRAVPFDTDGTVVLLGRDLSPIAETQAQLVQAQMSLEQGYEARREFDARYRILLRTVRDPVVFVGATDGAIVDINEPAAALLGATREGLIGRPLGAAFADRDGADFMEALTQAAGGDDGRATVFEVARTGKSVHVTAQMFRAAGERAVICRLSGEAAAEDTRSALSVDLGILFERSSDAIVFTSLNGEILNCNDSFLDLLNAAQASEVSGENLSTFLGRGRIDLNVLVENARRLGQMRLYSTKLVSRYGGSVPVEMSVTYLNDRADPVLALVLRDSTRSEAVRSAQAQGSPESARSVMELVGSATLKEIVAETTDVVEKMCIETAVHLTRNNRVAAAEMLGLSRQSLYVKLRKYGLLNREPSGEE